MAISLLQQATTRLEALKQALQASGKLSEGCYRFVESFGAEAVDYPETGWTPLNGMVNYAQDDGVLWVRFRIRVPEQILQISPAGGQVRLRSFFQAPVQVFVDGQLRAKEDNWLDLQTPELVLTDSAVPGTVYSCAMRIDCAGANWGGAFHCWVEYDPIDTLLWQTQTMQEELAYACTLPGGEALLEGLLPAIVSRLQTMLDTQDATGLADLLAELRRQAEPLRAAAKQQTVHMIAHAHIDMNWLWGMQETRDVIHRDFSTLCQLMDENPDLCFSQSQTAAYAIAQEDDPALFAAMKKHIDDGRWEVTAAAWVEHDANLPSGESLARQILYSQLYTDEHLHTRATIQWAPDTFGHSGNLPQLLHKSGIHHYFHSRCMPGQSGDITEQILEHESAHRLFVWEGIDGSRVLDTMMCYGGNFMLPQATERARRATACGLRDAMCIYGVSDHGGGPTRRDIRQIRYADASPMLPHLVFSTTERYFAAVESQPEALAALHCHKGELNTVFEGCYTSTSTVKRRNRLLETRLAQTEALYLLLRDTGVAYPQEQLTDCWKTLLFHQFHDIMDGCAVSGTYEEARRALGAVEETLDRLLQTAAGHLTAAADGQMTVVNLLPYNRSQWITMDIPADQVAVDNAGQPYAQELLADGRRAVYIPTLPPYGLRTVRTQPGTLPAAVGSVTEQGGCFVIDGPDYTVWLKRSSGEFTSFYDKRSGRFLAQQGLRCYRMDRGLLNTFFVTHELPETGMASWTFDRIRSVDYLCEKAVCRLLEDGPLRKRVEVQHRYGASTITQTILFDFTTPVIRFDTTVDWREVGSRKIGTPMLHVRFAPVLQEARLYNEIPFGVLQRPTEDAEQPQQRFSAIEDDAGGLLLYNDSKYGMHVTGNVISLSLLRSSWEPDQHADIGRHRFAYGLEAYSGRLQQTAALEEAAAFQAPCLCLAGTPAIELPPLPPLPAGIVLSGLKQAERSADVILRLYEAFGEARTITLPLPAGWRVEETQTDEQQVLSALPCENGGCTVAFAPYEIKTLRLQRA